MQREQETKTSEILANENSQNKNTKKILSKLNQNIENDDTDPPGG
jgi:hypothetical protein